MNGLTSGPKGAATTGRKVISTVGKASGFPRLRQML